MKQLIFPLVFLLCAWSISSKNIIVSTATEINGGSWSAGDTIVMKNGTWTNQSISFRAFGTITQPIVLLAETAGSVILTGSSKLSFSGSYIEISGLYFKDGTLSGSEVVSFRTSSLLFAENCRLTNTAIVNYNPALNTVDSKWVSLYGANNKVDHCSFVNKTNSGTLLVVWLVNGVTPSHIISDNYFGYRNSNLDSTGAEINGQEIIRVGDSGTSMTTASVTVERNAYKGVILNRTLALIHHPAFEFPVVIDIFKVNSDSTHNLDFSFYYNGQMVMTDINYQKNTKELKALGTKNGYQHLWLEATGKTDKPTASFTWVTGNRFYSITTLANADNQFMMTRIGAGDPDFNLRNTPCFMIRQQNTVNHTFVSVIEPHGLYDLTREVTLGFESNVANIELSKDDENFTAAKIKTKNNLQFLFITVNKDFGEFKNRTLTVEGKIITFTGNFYFAEINN